MSEDRSLARLLRQAREARGQTVEELCRQAGLGLNVVRALEEGRLDVVEPVYLRLAVQTLASHLQLDRQELVAQLFRELGPGALEPPAPPPAPASPGGGLEAASLRTLVVVAAVLVGLLGLLAFFWSASERQHAPLPRSAPAIGSRTLSPAALPRDAGGAASELDGVPARAQSEAPAAAGQPRAVSGTSDTDSEYVATAPQSPPRLTPPKELAAAEAEAPAAAHAEPAQGSPEPRAAARRAVELAIEALDTTWVQVRADGLVVFEGLLPRGERRTWGAQDQVLVTSGRARGCRYWIQGQPLTTDRLGDPTRVLRFRATPTEIVALDKDLNATGPPLPLSGSRP